MGYLYLLCVAMMFSFGGTCNRLLSPYFGTEFISLFRFVFGVFFLLLLKLIKRHRFREDFPRMLKACFGWILFGAFIKWGAYLTENYGIAHGPSYGNIICQPAQTIFLTCVSAFLFREKLNLKKVICIILCISGVLLISWNGRDLHEFLTSSIWLTLLFVISGIFAGGHVLAQKMIADRMDIIDSNLTIFAFGSVFALIPVVPEAASGALAGVHPNLPAYFAMLAFGFITGIGFYLNAKAIPLVPLYMVPVIQSAMVIFTVIWGVLFFHDEISILILTGIVLFLVGLILLNILNKLDEAEKA